MPNCRIASSAVGCQSDVFNPMDCTVLTPEFVALFDLTIVMMNPYFTHRFAAAQSVRPVVLLAGCRAYFYCSGLELPYTLNLIEAWMAGIPLVVMDERLLPRAHRYSEISRLITPGTDALLARSATEARIMLQGLLADPQAGARIGAAGRNSAIRHFGFATISEQWRGFLDAIVPRA